MPTTAGTVDSARVRHRRGQVAIAAGRDDTLPMLTGVRLEIDGDRLTLAATDRYRLAVRELDWTPDDPSRPTGAGAGAGPHPGRCRQEPGAQRHDDDRAVRPAGGTGEGIIGFSGTTNGRASRATTRLLDATFPAYRSLLPSEWASTAEIAGAAAGRGGASRVALVADRNTPGAAGVRRRPLALTAGGDDEGRAEEKLEVGYEGEPITTAFNPQFLLDGLGALPRRRARLLFTSATKPVVLRPGRPTPTARRVHLPDHAGPAAGLTPRSHRRPDVRPAPVASPTSAAGRAPTSPSSPGRSCWSGANGQGKTNLVEALGYLATLGSHRVATDAPLVRAGAERAVVRARGRGRRPRAARRGRDRARPGQQGQAQRRRRRRGRATCSASLRTVLFAPEDLAIVRGDPSERRRFLDELRRRPLAADGRRCARTTSGCSSSARPC